MAVLARCPDITDSRTGHEVFRRVRFLSRRPGNFPLEVGSTGMRIDFRYLSVGSLYEDGSKVTNLDHERETHLTQQFTFFYALTDRFTLVALAPLPRKHSEQLADNGQMAVGNQFGLGDIAFLVRSKLFVGHKMESTYILSVQAGAKLPTGVTGGLDNRGQLGIASKPKAMILRRSSQESVSTERFVDTRSRME